MSLFHRHRPPAAAPPVDVTTVDAIVDDLRDNATRLMATADQLDRMARRFEAAHPPPEERAPA